MGPRHCDRQEAEHYNYFRDYDPAIGRYIESDPVGLSGGLNTYGYVEGNAVSFLDRLGLAKHKPDSQHCKSLRGKIDRARKDLDRRWDELDRNPLNLPERIGPGEQLQETRRGHRTLINKNDANLRKLEQEYDDDCGGDDGPGGSCKANECPSAGTVLAAAAATAGAGYIAYRCLRMLPSLAPPLWWTIPANVATP